jgi:hypothetical protein
MINPILKSSIKDTLYDPYNNDMYGMLHTSVKKDCLDTGNNYDGIQYPFTSLDPKVDNVAELISNRKILHL